MRNIDLSKILSDPVMLSAFLSSSIRAFFLERGRENLAWSMKSISLKHTTLSIVTESPLVAHEFRLYSAELKEHLVLAFSRIGYSAPFRLNIK